MINNPANIDNDMVLAHGCWCLCRAAYPENQTRIQSIMDQRHANLKANHVAYCEGAML